VARGLQTVYLGDDATAFTVPCEACLQLAGRSLAGRHHATVEGSLRRDVDIGFRSCPRGHRLVLKRARAAMPARPLVA
jgi:hypothetical protein